MDFLDLTKPRTGNLMLCQCGHLKVFHFARPKWYDGPMTDHAPCAHCDDCKAYAEGAFQGYEWRMDPHAHE